MNTSSSGRRLSFSGCSRTSWLTGMPVLREVSDSHWASSLGMRKVSFLLMSNLQLRPQQADYVIRGDHARQLAFVVYDRKRNQVVFVKECSDLFFPSAGFCGDEE